MTCLQCRKCMCWVCGKAISGYDHFSQDKARCALFPGVLPDIAERFDYARNRPVHEVSTFEFSVFSNFFLYPSNNTSILIWWGRVSYMLMIVFYVDNSYLNMLISQTDVDGTLGLEIIFVHEFGVKTFWIISPGYILHHISRLYTLLVAKWSYTLPPPPSDHLVLISLFA